MIQPLQRLWRLLEKELNADYALDDMSEEMQGMAVRLYSLLTSYMRQRPLKLVRHVKQENGFVAWQTLLKEMQPATTGQESSPTDSTVPCTVCRGQNTQ